MNTKNLKVAFTLAEVLITLGIIGIVAAMSLHVLMGKYVERERITALKKTYSLLQQAFEIAVVKNGTPDSWGLSNDADGSVRLGEILTKEFKVVNNCKTGTGCWPDINYKYLNGKDWINVNEYQTFYKIVLVDGTLMRFSASSPDCTINNGSSKLLANTCGIIGVDINGFKRPNTVGVDYFNFWFTKYGIVPYGSQDNTTHAFQAQCRDKSIQTGLACTSWVLTNENMDYLHCNDLSWSKTKCSK